MEKLDLKRSLDSYQAARGRFRVVDVSALQYLMIDGNGDPNTGREFGAAVAALYPVAYSLKFASKAIGPAALADVGLETLDEGCAVQTLHVGSFDEE